MNLRWVSALCAVWFLSSACTAFPTIPSGECGNAVVEAHEDCDIFPSSKGSQCRDKSKVGACHWDCSVQNGKAAPCPEGWGCDADSICREPSGDFALPTAERDVGAWSLSSGDFDGDGREDVMSSEPLDSVGETRLRFFYFDSRGELEETHLFPKLLISPSIKDLSGDNKSDVAFALGSRGQSPVGVMRGRADRTWLPETFSSYRVPHARVRVVSVSDQHIGDSAPFVSLGTFPGETGFFVADPSSGKLVDRAPVKGTVADLVGDPVSGDLVQDSKHAPCFEPVFAFSGANHFSLVNPCDTNALGQVVWRDAFEVRDIALDRPGRIDAAPQIVDINGDGHLDVLVGVGGKPFVAFGDGVTLATAVPYQLFAGNLEQLPEFTTPLAVGDITGDGAPDFVFPDFLLTSSTAYAGALPIYSETRNRLTAAWTSAKFIDLNGNGKLDVVAASSGSLNVEFFNGTGTPYYTDSIISTSAPVQALAMGDLDSDQIQDLAVLEVPSLGEAKSNLRVLFGEALAPLKPALVVAQLAGAEAMTTYQDRGRGTLVVCSNELIDGTPSGALTFLQNGTDRVPFAPVTLTEFGSSGSVEETEAVGVAAGHFTVPDQGDLVALAFPNADFSSTRLLPNQAWLLPDVLAAGSPLQRLPADLSPRLDLVKFLPMNADFATASVSASADLDRDGRDEAIFAMPADSGQSCGLVVFGAPTAQSRTVVAREPLFLEEPCPDPRLSAVDADGDGFLDIALLTGQFDADDRKLHVFWNDGKGNFSSSDEQTVSGDESPQAFTALPQTKPKPEQPRERFGFVYLTKERLVLLRAAVAGRMFEQPTPIPGVSGGSGVVAADVNGDHVKDLVVGASGKLSVLLAQLRTDTP